MARASNFWVGMAMGGAVGAALALLYAPHSGRETRTQVKDTANRAQGKVSNMAQNVKQGVQHLKERGQQTVSTQQERIHEAVEAGKEAAEERRSELQSQVNM